MGDHETDVFITLAAAYRRKLPARQGVIGRVAPGACTKSKSELSYCEKLAVRAESGTVLGVAAAIGYGTLFESEG